MTDDFGHWLAGFLDGEGCFLVKRNRTTAGKVNPICMLEVQVRADDADILHLIAAETGLGRVQGKLDRRDQGERKPAIRWAVNRKSECVQVVQLLDRYPLRAKKARDYAIWRLAVAAWSAGDLHEALRLGGLLRDVRRYDAEMLDAIVDPPLALFDGET